MVSFNSKGGKVIKTILLSHRQEWHVLEDVEDKPAVSDRHNRVWQKGYGKNTPLETQRMLITANY